MRYFIFLAASLLLGLSSEAQNVGINTLKPEATLHVAGGFSFISKGTAAVKLVGLNSIGDFIEFPLGEEFSLVDGTLSVVPALDENIFLVSTIELPAGTTGGVYNNYDIGIGINSANSGKTIFRLTGETAGYVITGLLNGYDGRVVYIFNSQSNNVTFEGLDGRSNSENQFLLQNGSENMSGQGVAEFIYDGFIKKWVLVNIKN